jgi:hypothetical protein
LSAELESNGSSASKQRPDVTVSDMPDMPVSGYGGKLTN